MSTDEAEAMEAPQAPVQPSASPPQEPAGKPRHRRSRRGPGPLVVFAAAFVLLLAAAVCVGIGNLRANTTLLPVISFYLSGAAVVLTVVALCLPAKRPSREEPAES
jgi:heme A synthase